MEDRAEFHISIVQHTAERNAGHLLLPVAWGLHASVRLQGNHQRAAAAAALQPQEDLNIPASVGATAAQMPSSAPQLVDQVNLPSRPSLAKKV